MITAIYVVLSVAFVLFAYRLARGPSLADRVIGIDGMLVSGISLLIANAVETERGTFMQVAVLLTLVSFIGTAVVARFIEGRGDEP
jgi:multisubunit Na+/H+ antiporter MnhF subunit